MDNENHPLIQELSDGEKHTRPVIKTPIFEKNGNKWEIEHQFDNHDLVIGTAEMNNSLYIFDCKKCTITVKGKINIITIDSCTNTRIIFNDLVSCIEFINCQGVYMQVLGKVPTISVNKTVGCQLYLNSHTLDAEIFTSSSSAVNVHIPNSQGDYDEYPIPEQYKTTFQIDQGLKTIPIDM